MGLGILKEMIAVIRAEQQRREALLSAGDPDSYYEWCFVNELCLMLLVTLRHQVERELVDFVALATDEVISIQQYDDNIEILRNMDARKRWKEVERTLNIRSCEEFQSMEALRLLANSYKHDALMEPAEKLLKLLNLETGVPYAPLPGSNALRRGFATFIGLEKEADYCDIAERFVDIASDFLKNVKGRTKLSQRPLRVASITEFAG